jgi:hypothetical protein
MNLFVIVLSLILFHGYDIYGLDNSELSAVNVIEKLKTKAPNCDLHSFVQSEKDYKTLIDDLNQYCSLSDSAKQYQLLCNMIYYELKRACVLPNELRPSKALYIAPTSSDAICRLKNIQLTNEWIFNKITSNGRKQINVKQTDLCKTVTTDPNTLRLARFFYKIAPRVRQADLSKKGNDYKNITIQRNLNLIKKHLSHRYYSYE